MRDLKPAGRESQTVWQESLSQEGGDCRLWEMWCLGAFLMVFCGQHEAVGSTCAMEQVGFRQGKAEEHWALELFSEGVF